MLGLDPQRQESMIVKLEAQISVDQHKDISPTVPGVVAGDNWNDSSSSLALRHAVHSTQHALDGKQDSVIPYGAGTNESDDGSFVRAPLRNLSGLQGREVGAETSLLERIPFYNVLNDKARARGMYMDEGEVGIMLKRLYRRDLAKPPQGNHNSSHGNSGLLHRYCRPEFTCGKALGRHMRAHGEMGSSISLMNVPWKELGLVEFFEISHAENHAGSDSDDEETEEESGWGEEKKREQSGGDGRREEEETSFVRGKSCSQAALNGLNNGCWAVSLCASKKEADGKDEQEERNHEEDKNARQLQEHETLVYALRRNPKRSRRFIDQDYTGLDIAPPPPPIPAPASSAYCSSPKQIATSTILQKTATRACCTECGKEFSSWKALFGHMRCHPEREWRGIQPPPELGSTSRTVKGEAFARHGSHLHLPIAVQRKIKPSETASRIAQPGLTVSTDVEEEEACQIGGGGGEGTWTGRVESECFSNKGKMRNSMVREASRNNNTTGVEEEVVDCSNDRVKLRLEENESETELSVEASYVHNATNHQSSLAVADLRHPHIRRKELRRRRRSHQQLPKKKEGASCFFRGKRSRRSRLTVRSLRAVSDSAAEGLATLSPSSIRLELHASATGREQVGDEERDMADSLVLLALAGSVADTNSHHEAEVDRSTEESAFAGLDGAGRGGKEEDNRDEMGELLALDGISAAAKLGASATEARYSGCGRHLEVAAKFECSSCKRKFKSHQALGGHRASHKKVKGCFARTPADVEAVGKPKAQIGGRCGNAGAATGGKGHQCCICFRGFSTGQALGGHKRCHWAGEKATSNGGETEICSHNPKRSNEDLLALDLNLPPEEDRENGCLDVVSFPTTTINGSILYRSNLNIMALGSSTIVNI